MAASNSATRSIDRDYRTEAPAEGKRKWSFFCLEGAAGCFSEKTQGTKDASAGEGGMRAPVVRMALRG